MTLTLEQMKANRKLWVEALRSGKYEQTKNTLTDGGGYCCLGVACLVAGKTYDDICYDQNLGNFRDVREFFGLKNGGDGDFDGGSLVHFNDDEDKSFAEIAAIIESEPPGLFVESDPVMIALCNHLAIRPWTSIALLAAACLAAMLFDGWAA